MAAGAPGEQIAEGEAVQEHDLESRRARRDQMANNHGQRAPTQRETTQEASRMPMKTKPERWDDWYPHEEATLTIGALVKAARARGIDVDLSTIRFWQKAGILPLPARRKAERGTYAVYPPVAVDLMQRIRALQVDGLSLKEIGPRIRGEALTTRVVPQSANISVTGHPVTGTATTSLEGTVRGTSRVSGDLTATSVPDELRALITEAARTQETRTGTPVTRVDITFTDAHDRKTAFNIPISEE